MSDMNFHLSFPVKEIPEKLDHRRPVLFIGSCFSENIAAKMSRLGFRTLVNPHGVLYNPSAIATALQRYVSHSQMKAEELFQANGCWNSWEHHSRFSEPDQETCITVINAGISRAHDCLHESSWLFITFGSAFVYSNSEGKKVGNCHKLPQREFTKSMLSADQITEEYSALITQLQKFNPDLKILLTISPVRYVRDGVVENNLSKAMLIQAVHQIVAQNSKVFYFPSYELMMDDLRDYRFYKQDLVHPNEQAIDYIFEKLQAALFTEETSLLCQKINEIVTASEHKPLHPETEEFLKFRKAYKKKAEQLKHNYPFIELPL
jgi:lysophospholipase L1-like esterase